MQDGETELAGMKFVITSNAEAFDAETKIAYLKDLKEISFTCENAEEMRKKVQEKYAGYSGLNYLDMTVGFFFPDK